MKSTTRWLLMLFILGILSCTSDYSGDKNQEVIDSINSDDDSCKTVVNYFDNGIIESQGQLCNGEQNGRWQAFYADGTLKWEGIFFMGYRKAPKLDSLDLRCNFIFENNDNRFILNEPRQFRIIASPLGPGELIVHIKRGEIHAPMDGDYFDHAIIPDTVGELCIEVLYRYQPDYSICKECFTVYPANADL